MADVVSVRSEIKIISQETCESALVSGESHSPTAFQNAASTDKADGTGSVVVAQHYGEEITLAGSGAASETIALNSWTDWEGEAKDSTGKKVQIVHAFAPATNSGDVTLGPAAVDGYQLFGPLHSIDIPPGSEVYMRVPEGLADVGTLSGVTETDLLVSGLGGDVLELELLIG